MLLPISGKRAAKEEGRTEIKAETKAPAAKKPVRSSARAKKAG